MSNLPATFEQRVKERINDTIADLIPTEELDALVGAQVTHFRREELPKLIRAEIHAQMAAAIKAELAKEAYQTIWQQNGTLGASEAVKKIVTENTGAILNSMIGSMVQMTIQSMQGNMPRMY